MTQFVLQGSNALIHKATGVNVAEIVEVGIYIEGKTVHGDKATGPYPDGTDLPRLFGIVRIEPHPGGPVQTTGREPILRHGFNNGLLQMMDVFSDAQAHGLQIENRSEERRVGKECRLRWTA